ncbi:MAG: cold-shock protein [Candidatus Liberibacter europaeus]|uniref:Cold-shock protein n=1 Tax=Candidatus Liberibacter europaeus TaxID=744859 RepID=A0A2T4VWL7_9HYPH|nr:cold-shock protein [Candidatus Liberibacter europaeus]PTL86169.1 MAG: cold-shock protein [Candidatus Liberibacter europaeus]
MATGCVKWFNHDKRYGFVTPHDSSQRDVFLHQSALDSAGIQNIMEGQEISYDFLEDKNSGKSSAVNIKLL